MKKIISFSIFLISIFTLLVVGYYIFVQKANEKPVNGTIIEESEYFKIINQGEGKYHYIIYNREKDIVKEDDQYGTIPSISHIDTDNLQILLSGGTDTFVCIYYNISNNIFSEQYISPVIVKYGKIAYIDFDKDPFTFIVCDIFNKNIFFKEFELDFSFSVSPIIKAEFLDEYTLSITYLSGEFFEEKKVTLSLK